MFEEKKEFLRSENVMIAILVIIILSITSFYLLKRNSDKIVIEKKSINEDYSGVTTGSGVKKTLIEKNEEEIKVYMVGEVVTPGVYSLKKGQIFEDAVNMAGGFTKQADIESINLVYKLNENVMIKVLSKNNQSNTNTNTNTNSNSNAQNNTQSNKKAFEIITDHRGVVENNNQEVSSGKDNSNSKVNINSATKEQLKSLSGVGDSTAEKIIQYRQKSGSFKTIEELKKVAGIGDAKYNAIKDRIVVN